MEATMTSPSTSFTAYVGIDWADRKHNFCLQAAGASTHEAGVIEHTPEAIAQWACSLYDRFGGPIAVCLEIAKGPLALFPPAPPTRLARLSDRYGREDRFLDH
jgi:hypothetical protein